MLQHKLPLAEIAVITLIIFVFACTARQNPISVKERNLKRVDSGTLFVTLGRDTTIIQNYRIDGDSIITRILYMPGGVYLTEGKGMFYPDGKLKSMVSLGYNTDSLGELQLDQETRLTTTEDSTFITAKKGDNVVYKKMPGRCLVTNEGDWTTFFLFPFMGHYSPQMINDSIIGDQFVFEGVRKYTIKRKTQNSILVGSDIMGNLTLNLDGNNQLNSIDGIGSSLNFIGVVNRHVNFDSIVKTKIDKQLSSGKIPVESPRDTVSFVKNDLIISVDYSRPSVRGREIFGKVVPWNRFWRVGANRSTEITFNKPVLINGQTLDKGHYSLFIVPKQKEWTVMFNKQTNIWGTDYNPLQDAIRVTVIPEKLPDLVEQLSITLSPTDDGASLNIQWERTKATVSVKQ